MSKNKKYLFIAIFLLGLILRFLKLGESPPLLSCDEAALGYNAYSILKTGKDEYGISYPLAFRSFGEYKAPLYIYTTIPFIATFGLNEFATRLPSAFFGVLTVMLVYFLSKQIFGKVEIALFSSFVLSILPWHLQFTRIAYEGSITVFLLTAATIFFLKGVKKGRYLLLSCILLVLTFYSHYAVRVFTPLYFSFLVLIFFKKIIRLKKELFLSFLLVIFILKPLVPFLFSEAGLSRASYISFLTDKGLIFGINEKIAEHEWSDIKIIPFPRIIHNKIIDYSKRFIENYLGHFDFSFLFIKGDEDKLFKTPFTGLILITFLPPLLIGLVKLFKEKNIQKNVILSWLFLAPIPSSLTRLSASGNRAFIMVIPVVIVIALGIVTILDLLKMRKGRLILIGVLSLFIFEYILYLDSFYVHFPFKNIGDSRLGSKEMIREVDSLTSNYSEVWVTNKSGGYIHFVFHLKYPPEDYQKEARLGPLDEFGFGGVIGFDKYKFDRIPKYFDFSQNILYVAASGEEPKGLIPLKKIFHPDGRIAFLIFDTEKVLEQCPNCSLSFKPTDINIYGEKIETE